MYWEDTDAAGIVFYANYLKFFERARTEWLRVLGFGQQDLRTREGAVFVVAHTAVSYHAPARLDDELTITVTVQEAGRASLTLQQSAWRHDPNARRLLAEGTIRIGCVDAATFRPRRVPTEILEAIR